MGSKFLKYELILGFVFIYILIFTSLGILQKGKTDLDVFFVPSAKKIIHGNFLQIYSVRSNTISNIYPNANGPIALLPLSIGLNLLSLVKLDNNIYAVHAVSMALAALFMVFAAKEAVSLICKQRPNISLRGKIFSYSVLLFSPLAFLGVVVYGHLELPIMLWLFLYGVRLSQKSNFLLAGIILGLTVLTRSMSIIYILPLIILIFQKTGLLNVIKLFVSISLTGLLLISPFLLFEPGDFTYSIFGFRSTVPVSASSLWHFGLSNVARYDSVLIALAVSALSYFVLKTKKLPKQNPFFFAVLAVAGSLFILLIKTPIQPYYFLDPYFFSLIFWASIGFSRRTLWIGIWLVFYAFSGLLVFFNKSNQAYDFWTGGWYLLDIFLVLSVIIFCKFFKFDKKFSIGETIK